MTNLKDLTSFIALGFALSWALQLLIYILIINHKAIKNDK